MNQNSNLETKVVIALKQSPPIVLHLNQKFANEIIDQYYSILSGELEDNCLEIKMDHDSIVISNDAILYVHVIKKEDNE